MKPEYKRRAQTEDSARPVWLLCKRLYGARSGFTGWFMSVEHRNNLTSVIGSLHITQTEKYLKNIFILRLNANLNNYKFLCIIKATPTSICTLKSSYEHFFFQVSWLFLLDV